MLVKLKGTVVLPAGSPGGIIKIRYPRAHQDNARTAGGMFDGLVTAAGALTAADGTDLIVLGSALGENDPPTLVLTITPTGHTPYTLSIKPVPNLPVPGAPDVVDITKPSDATPVLTSPTITQLLTDTGAAKTSALAAAGTANTAAGAADTSRVQLTTAVGQSLADSAQTQAQLLRIAGLTPWAGGDHTTLPNPAGDYLITRGAEQGQVWTRLTAGAAPTRNTVLEVKPSLIGTRAQRLTLAAPVVVTRYYETDTHLALTYTPGTGWRRDGDGGDPDYVAPPTPPDTGGY
ncbi:hypothetical protein [Deinococcus sp. UYEF24]